MVIKFDRIIWPYGYQKTAINIQTAQVTIFIKFRKELSKICTDIIEKAKWDNVYRILASMLI